MHELQDIGFISVPRFMFSGRIEEVKNVEIHGFCDASKRASKRAYYGAAVYLRIPSPEGYCPILVCFENESLSCKGGNHCWVVCWVVCC